MDLVRAGGTLVVTKLGTRIAALEKKGVAPRIVNLGVDTFSSTGKLILNALGGVAQFEREMMPERQREGIAKAKRDGPCKSCKPAAPEKSEEIKALATQGLSMNAIATKLGICRGSVHRALAARRPAA